MFIGFERVDGSVAMPRRAMNCATLPRQTHMNYYIRRRFNPLKLDALSIAV
jgi:hypothetical protein